MRVLRRACGAAGLLMLAACATVTPPPAQPAASAVDGDIERVIAAGHGTDARYQSVIDRPYLKVDIAARYRMADYAELRGAEARRDFIVDFLRRAAALGEAAAARELAHLPPATLRDYARNQALPEAEVDPLKAVVARYRSRAAQSLAGELATVRALGDESALDAWWQALASGLQDSIMRRGRLARRLVTAPAVPIIAAWIGYHNWHDDRGPQTPAFAAQQVFKPRLVTGGHPEIGEAEWSLLERYAPIVVQEVAQHPAYPDTDDRFGTLSLIGGVSESAVPVVDSARPALYAFIEDKPIQGSATRQLVYVLWYPRHPKLESFDPEAGPLDGWTLRVSLNAAGQPLVVESMSNCGCYYKIFPSAELEQASAAHFPDTLAGKRFHLEQHQADRFDAVVPETIGGLEAGAPMVVYFSAAHHQLVTVRARAALDATALATATDYTLHPYGELEALPLGDRLVSVFGEDGLVRAAHRQECDLLAPSGVYHAGHPRQRETQMIYFDEADFDDPHLLERYLRLPPRAFSGDA